MKSLPYLNIILSGTPSVKGSFSGIKDGEPLIRNIQANGGSGINIAIQYKRPDDLDQGINNGTL